jgi:hypothetical protein
MGTFRMPCHFQTPLYDIEKQGEEIEKEKEKDD